MPTGPTTIETPSPVTERELTPIERAIQENRLGRFIVPDALRLEDPQLAWLVIAQTYVLRAEHRLDQCGTEYIAFCPHFCEHLPGQVMRNYAPLVESDDGYNAAITWG